jgi:SPP1 gp7 family putative phage head morphogenesis protein
MKKGLSARERLRRLIAAELAAEGRTRTAFAGVGARIVKLIKALQAAAARLFGTTPVPEPWVRAQAEFKQVQVLIVVSTQRVAATATRTVEAAADLALLPLDVASDARTAAVYAAEAVATLRKSLPVSGPLTELLSEFIDDTLTKTADVITEAVTTRQRATEAARHVREVIESTARRAKLIIRTEQHRVYREAARAIWRFDPRVTGWMWVSTFDHRSCGSCLAMHGTIHPLTEPMVSHPGCRCSMEPVTAATVPLGSGEDKFRRLTPDEQDHALGKAAGAAYRDGLFPLFAAVTRTDSPRWGPGINTTPFHQLVTDPDQRAAYLAAARRRAPE